MSPEIRALREPTPSSRQIPEATQSGFCSCLWQPLFFFFSTKPSLSLLSSSSSFLTLCCIAPHHFDVHRPQRLWFPVPSRPRNFQAITVSPNLIQLAWEPPEGSEDSPTNRVLEYLLKYSAAGSVRVFSRVLPGDKKAYLMQNLTPDTSYTILLTAKTNEGRGVPAKTTGKTKEYGEWHLFPFSLYCMIVALFSFYSWQGGRRLTDSLISTR